ncbi:hypothetical protein WMY93_025058 [Mugilogobius chulae]|uniref:Uncharacterized protein n=1 Tax=Mugilogobius chulae TaxID=88201 RepID=A0AAW0N4L8_9GOBI
MSLCQLIQELRPAKEHLLLLSLDKRGTEVEQTQHHSLLLCTNISVCLLPRDAQLGPSQTTAHWDKDASINLHKRSREHVGYPCGKVQKTPLINQYKPQSSTDEEEEKKPERWALMVTADSSRIEIVSGAIPLKIVLIPRGDRTSSLT